VRLSLTRSSVINTIALTIVLAALPGAIWRLVETRDPYLFTAQFFADIYARLCGPGRIRFVLQPTMALLIGIRDGIRDSRVQNPPFLSALLVADSRRRDLLQSGFRSVRDLVALAIVLDLISQFLIFKKIYPGAALLVGPLLIAVPYCTSRGLANRIAQLTRYPRS
jgi:hypothetical protein